MSYEKKENGNVNERTVSTVVLNMPSANVQHMAKFVINAVEKNHFANVCKTKVWRNTPTA